MTLRTVSIGSIFLVAAFAGEFAIRSQENPAKGPSRKVLELVLKEEVATELGLSVSQRAVLRDGFGKERIEARIAKTFELLSEIEGSRKVSDLIAERELNPEAVLSDLQLARLQQIGLHSEICEVGFEKAISGGEFGRLVGLEGADRDEVLKNVKQLEGFAIERIKQILWDLQEEVLEAIPLEKRAVASATLGRPFFTDELFLRIKKKVGNTRE